MRSTRLPLLFLLSLLISCSGGSNDLDRSGIKGKVKSTKEQQFEATHQDDRWVAGNPNPMGVRIVNYNEDGMYVESIALSIDGDTVGISKSKRENGEMVEDNYYSRFDGKTTRTLLERVSDEQVNFELWQDDQLIYEGANYFDGRGRVVKQVQVGGDREVTIHHVYEKNLLVEHYREEVTGERTATQLYEYDDFDDNGNWTVKLIYIGEDKITPKMVIARELTYY